MSGDEFRAWRERHRMTQDQAAALHCVSARTVRSWEAEGVGDPRSVLLCASWDWLLPERRKQLLRLAQRVR
ncbi:helix-turn-helix domain-containing protein [Azospirillum soli]|uniref:helix-turn-helix domain-containing protein n=1 Tax=Azospirillum soli TaxID=1304799 RepID=UPI001AE45809|nr:helix-turn-helix domain-containing protein [Azospirillum soli]MBP2311899.1 DNA-binding XRE family transcriptional regulator [Azospirillum soli]